MVHEPEEVLYRFANRADRWKRRISYEEAESRKGKNVSATRFCFSTQFPAMTGKKIAFFSDIHFRARPLPRRIAAEAAEMIGEFRPDYLIAGGDLSDYAVELDALSELLGYFDAIPAVKLAVMGNWEYRKLWLPVEWWIERYAAHGFRLLHNEMYSDPLIEIYGSADPNCGRLAAPKWEDRSKMRVMAAHNPDAVIALESPRNGRLHPLLALCGHTHGGQIRLPLIGALRSSSTYGRRFDYGLFESSLSGTRMIISSGLGERTFPFRFRCRREVVLVEFTAPENPS